MFTVPSRVRITVSIKVGVSVSGRVRGSIRKRGVMKFSRSAGL